MTECLFIGGSSDGDILEVDLTFDLVAFTHKGTQELRRTEVYRRHQFNRKGKQYTVYLYSLIKDDSVFDILINGYRNQEGGCI